MAAAALEPEYILQKEDGSEVTAQEVYDALMSGPVFLHEKMRYLAPTGWVWFDINSTQDDPTNVGLVMVEAGRTRFTIGDTSLGR